jgi:peroxiredoxin
MKIYLALALVVLSLAGLSQSPTLTPGQTAPDFSLTNVDNKSVSLKDYPSAKGFILVFTCNTCPYSKAYEQRINELNAKYESKGFPVVAINPNSASASPGDSFEKMKEHAKSAKFTFPYLYDKDQTVTTTYGARNTPHVFVVLKTTLGNVIEYTGAIDNDTQNTSPGKTLFVEDAVNALLKNVKPERAVTKAIGCSVKWKKT